MEHGNFYYLPFWKEDHSQRFWRIPSFFTSFHQDNSKIHKPLIETSKINPERHLCFIWAPFSANWKQFSSAATAQQNLLVHFYIMLTSKMLHIMLTWRRRSYLIPDYPSHGPNGVSCEENLTSDAPTSHILGEDKGTG